MTFANWNPVRRWREKRARRESIEQIHGEIVAAARAPELYTMLGVPDDIDGRFEIMILHTGLLLRRLAECGGPAQPLAQEIVDRVFVGFEDALREMAISDTGLAKRLKLMTGAFFGRTAVYHAAIDAGNPRALAEALARNIYRGKVENDAVAPRLLAARALAAARALEAVAFAEIAGGAFRFPKGQGGEL